MYATQADIENRLAPAHLIELADDDSNGVADSDVIEACIVDADALIDTFLKARYVVPLTDVPAVIRKISADLAIESFFARKRESASPVHEDRANVARELLKSMSEGRILLAEAGEQQMKGSPESTSRGQEKTFSRDSLGAY